MEFSGGSEYRLGPIWVKSETSGLFPNRNLVAGRKGEHPLEAIAIPAEATNSDILTALWISFTNSYTSPSTGLSPSSPA
jgi:hypothetical protein